MSSRVLRVSIDSSVLNALEILSRYTQVKKNKIAEKALQEYLSKYTVTNIDGLWKLSDGDNEYFLDSI